MLNILAKAKRKNVYNKHVQLPGMLTNIPRRKPMEVSCSCYIGLMIIGQLFPFLDKCALPSPRCYVLPIPYFFLPVLCYNLPRKAFSPKYDWSPIFMHPLPSLQDTNCNKSHL